MFSFCTCECQFCFFLFFDSPVEVKEALRNGFWRFNGISNSIVPVPLDEKFCVWQLSDVSHYPFNKVVILAHGVLFISVIIRRR